MVGKRLPGKARAGIVVPLAVAVLLAVAAFLKRPGPSAKKQMGPFTAQPIAHRGYFDNMSTAPENSLAAFRRAIEHGYAVELDVRLTADGTAVVLHDESLLRATGVDCNVRDMTDVELGECRLFSSDERVPTLEEALELTDGQVPLLVEIKSGMRDDAAAVSAATAATLDGYRGEYAVQSFNPLVLWWFRKNRSAIPRGLLLKDFIASGEGHSIVVCIALAGMFANVAAHPNFIACELKSAGQPTFEVMKRLFGLPMLAWTVKSPDELDAACANGFDGYIFEGFEA